MSEKQNLCEWEINTPFVCNKKYQSICRDSSAALVSYQTR